MEKYEQKTSEETDTNDTDTNETMKLLSKQNYSGILDVEAYKMVNDVIKAQPYSLPLLVAHDLFVAGYICGKASNK